MTLSSEGVLQGKDTFNSYTGSHDVPKKVVSDAEGGYLLLGQGPTENFFGSSLLVRYSAQSDIRWALHIDNTLWNGQESASIGGAGLVINEEGNYLLNNWVSFSGNTRSLMNCISPEGEILWSRPSNLEIGMEDMNSFSLRPDGSIVLAGHTFANNTFWLEHINANGQLLKTQSLESEFITGTVQYVENVISLPDNSTWIHAISYNGQHYVHQIFGYDVDFNQVFADTVKSVSGTFDLVNLEDGLSLIDIHQNPIRILPIDVDNKTFEQSKTINIPVKEKGFYNAHFHQDLNGDFTFALGLDFRGFWIGKFSAEPQEPLVINDDYKQNGNLEIYPNPSANLAYLKINNPVSQHVEIKVLNTLGQPLANVYSGFLPSGKIELVLDGLDLPNGIYFINLSDASGERKIKRWVVSR